ncbi:PrpF family protein [Bradyrhizobium sp. AUGA SZCCT0240]|uniref:2-methylaconitate cis-trans isomerase PrpF family protein n=1 Tax=unclassified Bradyrhizobium TaxID=2631580 RepID=UPI001BA7B6F8|nr:MULTISPECIES: PrpF domain-containing protein [unclassified Bradyrhizobium]MBR1192768.1 PrpF family protein [Bradyrhizobium sp. AUGA SZCCT0160]MBR1197461.1 PrpF family protein [Bradyrhizobium sp. AUGA SZCCT0158]MBR1243710.1 PrpF family protein [Bradyrhizobium sp. AUGA SZCCT0274]MBR1254907.1 PrpF family protein [Bradyrhizobium sp. AUGA SZCCT0240]
MANARLRAVFMRGGTSKAVMFRRDDLPHDPKAWDPIFLEVMGSPDPNGRQLDGMGGGISSLSKICIIGPPSRTDADVDYTFAQIGVRDTFVDYGANCGNMSSAVGPFALDEGLVTAPANGEATVRIHNTNTSKIIVARFPVENGSLAATGDIEIDGIAGKAAPIRLEFLEPGGARTGALLPTGNAVDDLDIDGGESVKASCVDAANPCVFVAASAAGKSGDELPDVLDNDAAFLQRMEAIRCAASVKMGIAPDLDQARRMTGIPKVAMVTGPRSGRTLSGRELAAEDADIWVRMISVGLPHRATPITGAICLAVASRIPGSIPAELCKANGPIRIAHPSGVTLVDAGVSPAGSGAVKADYGAVYRSARRLFEGNVVYRTAIA